MINFFVLFFLLLVVNLIKKIFSRTRNCYWE